MNRKIQVPSQIAAQPALTQGTCSHLLRWFFLETGKVTAISRYDCVSDRTESPSADQYVTRNHSQNEKKKKNKEVKAQRG